ncbi:MAG: patatin-like phospholipase family protein [Desulfobacteraceae bacterium]|nr:patatin-like phospholipase family protein [Desulfobacteraceae bacterium]
MNTLQPVSFWAGKKAFSKIMDSGLSSGDIRVIAGAAGGPKWLVLNALGRAMFSRWIKNREKPLFLIGSSIGSWRFAAAACKDAQSAIDRFESAYIRQSYRKNPPPEDIDRELESVLDILMGPDGAEQILCHPFFRINIMTVRCKGLTKNDDRKRLVPGFAMAGLLNAVSRRSLKLFFERTLFYDQRDLPPFFDMPGFPINRVSLDTHNLKPALLASGSVPMLMSGITGIPNAPAGIYRDGGLLDYHLNIEFLSRSGNGIVLFPHYAEKIVPGWLDKQVPWRKPDFSCMENVLVIAPGREFIKSLPLEKIPDRKDFYLFAGKDKERMNYWQKVVERGRELAEDFMEAVESGKIRQRLRPIENLGQR